MGYVCQERVITSVLEAVSLASGSPFGAARRVLHRLVTRHDTQKLNSR